MTEQTFAILYAALAIAPAFVQVALLLGAPWGVLTMGGRWPGKLPLHARFLALLQAALLCAMALVVLTHGGVIDAEVPQWAFYAVGAIAALSALANLSTPSRPERLMWGPVTVAMLASYSAVALL